jgi:hypothetical protein
VKLPAVVELHDRVAVPEPVTLLGPIEPQFRPVGTSVRVTLLENPFRAATFIVEEAEEPTGRAAGEVAEMEKSTTWKVIGRVMCGSVPFVPVTVTV